MGTPVPSSGLRTIKRELVFWIKANKPLFPVLFIYRGEKLPLYHPQGDAKKNMVGCWGASVRKTAAA